VRSCFDVMEPSLKDALLCKVSEICLDDVFSEQFLIEIISADFIS
jgi:hypothetical protein